MAVEQRAVEQFTWAYRRCRSLQRLSPHRCRLARLSGVVRVGVQVRSRPSAGGRLSVGKGRPSSAVALGCND